MLFNQRGFTLVELMVVIAIVATLSAIGLPGYQRYLDRAAMTEMLHMLGPYKAAVELCALQYGGLSHCRSGQGGIPEGQSSRYVDHISVRDGAIGLAGRQALRGLTLTLTPVWHAGGLRWTRHCQTGEEAQHLIAPCQALFQVDQEAGASV